MVNLVFIVVPQLIKAQAVFLLIYNIRQLNLQGGELSSVYITFKDGVLNSLSVVLAQF